MFHINGDTVQNNEGFVDCFHLETSLELQLTADNKSDSSQKKTLQIC